MNSVIQSKTASNKSRQEARLPHQHFSTQPSFHSGQGEGISKRVMDADLVPSRRQGELDEEMGDKASRAKSDGCVLQYVASRAEGNSPDFANAQARAAKLQRRGKIRARFRWMKKIWPMLPVPPLSPTSKFVLFCQQRLRISPLSASIHIIFSQAGWKWVSSPCPSSRPLGN